MDLGYFCVFIVVFFSRSRLLGLNKLTAQAPKGLTAPGSESKKKKKKKCFRYLIVYSRVFCPRTRSFSGRQLQIKLDAPPAAEIEAARVKIGDASGRKTRAEMVRGEEDGGCSSWTPLKQASVCT